MFDSFGYIVWILHIFNKKECKLLNNKILLNV